MSPNQYTYRVLINIHRVLINIHRVLINIHRVLINIHRVLINIHRVLINIFSVGSFHRIYMVVLYKHMYYRSSTPNNDTLSSTLRKKMLTSS